MTKKNTSRWSEQEKVIKVNQKVFVFQDKRTKRGRDKSSNKRKAIEDSQE